MKKTKFILAFFLIFGVIASSVFAQDAPQKKKEGKLKVLGHLQVRYGTYKDDHGGNDSFKEPNWYFRRMRLGTKYKSADKTWGGVLYWKLENALDSAKSKTTTITDTDTDAGSTPADQTVTTGSDADVAVIYANTWFKPMKMLKIVAGQYKVPYQRENTRSSKRMYVDEWGPATGTLFDIGAYAHVTPMKPLDVWLNVSNGYFDTTGVKGKAAMKTPAKAFSTYGDGTPFTSLRVQYQVMGKKVGIGKEPFGKGLGLSLGLAGGMSSKLGASGDPKNTSYNTFTFDGAFYMDGLAGSFQVARHGLTLDSGVDGVDAIKSSTLDLMVEVGYNIKIGKRGIMPAVRYENSKSKSDATGSSDSTDTSLGGGLNFFWHKHAQRLSLTYMKETSDDGTDKEKDDRIVFEYQFTH